MTNIIAAAKFVIEARVHLAKARRYLRGVTQGHLRATYNATAKWHIRAARQAWAAAQVLIATGQAEVSHHYNGMPKDGIFPAAQVWRAEVCIAGQRDAWLWRSERRYAQRQSAQRAALRAKGWLVSVAGSIGA